MTVRPANNLVAVFLMVVSMAAFAIEDVFYKFAIASGTVGEVFMAYSLTGTAVLIAVSWASRTTFSLAPFKQPALIVRTLAEVVATITHIVALVSLPLSTATALFQTSPLFLTLGAALVLGERVGVSRWLALALGFAGVILIVQPGQEGFTVAALFAIASSLAVATRDIATRSVPKDVPTSQVLLLAYVALIPIALVVLFGSPGPSAFSFDTVALTVCASLIGLSGFYMLVQSLRIGEVSAVATFRYVRLPFALILGHVMFAEVPDATMLIGSAIVVATGAFLVVRERVVAQRRSQAARSS